MKIVSVSAVASLSHCLSNASLLSQYRGRKSDSAVKIQYKFKFFFEVFLAHFRKLTFPLVAHFFCPETISSWFIWLFLVHGCNPRMIDLGQTDKNSNEIISNVENRLCKPPPHISPDLGEIEWKTRLEAYWDGFLATKKVAFIIYITSASGFEYQSYTNVGENENLYCRAMNKLVALQIASYRDRKVILWRTLKILLWCTQ